MNEVINHIRKRLDECNEYLAVQKICDEFYICQGQQQIYASALQRPEAISLGFVESLIDENEATLTTLTKKTDILRQQGHLLALHHVQDMIKSEQWKNEQ